MPRFFLIKIIILVGLVFALTLSPARADLTFQFDYSHDTRNFFVNHPQAKVLLEKAAQFYGVLIQDNLDAIVPNDATPSDFWVIGASDPTDPANFQSDFSLYNPTMPANTLLVFAGGTNNLASGTLGYTSMFGLAGGEGPISGWTDTFETRGQTGALAAPGIQTDLGPSGGTISFNENINWFFANNPDTDVVPAGQYDFYSYALEEIGRILGAGIANPWFNLNINDVCIGPAAKLANAGVFPAFSGNRWAANAMSTVFGTKTVQAPLFNFRPVTGVRKLVTTLDLAVLADMGWQIANPVPLTGNVSVTAVAGKAVTFFVSPDGNGPFTYQWQLSVGGGAFTNLAEGNSNSGTATAKLTIPTTDRSTLGTGDRFRCIISSAAGNVTSGIALLSVQVPPKVTVEPDGFTAIPGQTVTLSANLDALGTKPYNFQWRKGGTMLPNETKPTLTLKKLTLNDENRYSVTVYNAGGVTTSLEAELFVTSTPYVNVSPSNITVAAGKPATFTVAAIGSAPLTYQWQSSIDGGGTFANLTEGGGITGTKTSRLLVTTSKGSTDDNGNVYRCWVINAAGYELSENGILTVVLPPSITPAATNLTAFPGDSANLTVNATGGGTLSYQWQRSPNGTAWTNLTDGNGISGSATSLLSLSTPTTTYFRCVATNSVGSTTTGKILLTVNYHPGGIYFGTFAGAKGAGKFAALVQVSQVAVLFGFDTTHKNAFTFADFSLADDGTFSISDGGGSAVTGTFTPSTAKVVSSVTGTVNGRVTSSPLKGTHKTDAGKYSVNAGYYSGSYSGSASGTIQAIIASDGSLILYSVSNDPNDEGDGGTATLAATGNFSVSTVKGVKMNGTFDFVNNTITGTYKTPQKTTGTFSLSLEIGP